MSDLKSGIWWANIPINDALEILFILAIVTIVLGIAHDFLKSLK